MAVLRIADAHKSFGSTAALRGLGFELAAGESLALLGPNGAGKTTLIRAIAGRLRLDRGSIQLDGVTLAAGRPRDSLGVVPQDIALYPLLTARENLQVFGRLHGLAGTALARRVEAALGWIGLADRAKEPIQHFSGGMKRRLNIACGVLHEPDVVLLDEPTVGVDPQSRERIWEMLSSLTDRGASLLVTTHMLEEAEDRCQRIVIVDHGVQVAAGTLPELLLVAGLSERRVRIMLDHRAADVFPAGSTPPAGLRVTDDGTALVSGIRDVGRELPPLVAALERAGQHVSDLDVRGAGLHDVFLALTGKELRE